MLTYRARIYTLAMVASAEATKLALALSECVGDQQAAEDPRSVFNAYSPSLRSQAGVLRTAVDEFWKALPCDVQDAIKERTLLKRHLGFIDYWLQKDAPRSCAHDPVDIVSSDLPKALAILEEWYSTHSPPDETLISRLEPHIVNGQLNAAVREAWVIFKTRMVKLFNLPADMDGDKLAGKLFGGRSATTQFLDDHEREGYLHLFKGLYALSRNPVAHNDVPPNPEETEAVLALLNSALVNIESAHNAAVAESASSTP